MKAWAIKTPDKTQKGFTIVELLIVIVVISILATISIVAYNGIQNRAADAVLEADLSNIAKKMELERVNLGRYPETNAEMPEYKLSKQAYDPTRNNAYLCVDRVNHKYAFGAESKSDKGYIQTSDGRLEDVSVSGAATCNAIGVSTWANNSTSAVFQGYSGSTKQWTTSWKWAD